MRRQDGFTLSELLILLAIVLLIAAIALPNLLRSRIAASESAAVDSIRKINKAQVAYQTTYPTIGFASTLHALGPDGGSECSVPSPRNACLIDAALAEATSVAEATNGYWFVVSPTRKDSNAVVAGYVAGGAAAVFNQTGVRDFCSTEEGVLHYQVPASQSVPVVTDVGCNSWLVLH
jgi:prepilin-type N-terminal cleavage/methylation domain-containing protein